MPEYEYYPKPEFKEVEAYVNNGLPKEHWCRENEDIKRGKQHQKVWLDTNESTGEHEYDQYLNDKVKHAARFRDGLVSDVYDEFRNDFPESWAEEYKKYSEVVYRHLNGTSPDDKHYICGEDAHTIHGDGSLCSKSVDQINLMQFHIGPIQGQQAEHLMRLKVFAVLQDDIEKLPKGWSKERSKKSQVKYVHALAVVLYTIVNQRDWIECKVYTSGDFVEFFDATARIQNVMTLLIKDEIFDDASMYKVFNFYYRKIQEIDGMNNKWAFLFEQEDVKKKRFFTSVFLTKMHSMEKSLNLKHGEQIVESLEGDEGSQKNSASGVGDEEGSQKKEEEAEVGKEQGDADSKLKKNCLPNTAASSSSTALVGSKRKNGDE